MRKGIGLDSKGTAGIYESKQSKICHGGNPFPLLVVHRVEDSWLHLAVCVVDLAVCRATQQRFGGPYLAKPTNDCTQFGGTMVQKLPVDQIEQFEFCPATEQQIKINQIAKFG
mmetsp:Transcript_40668/g.84657  ORF Transcript_40668/g.84657 Transcript_40668/m.84657 type:complete len:113 (-) Transcript_40668:44-382(-)